MENLPEPEIDIKFVIKPETIQNLLTQVAESETSLPGRLDLEILFPFNTQFLWKIVLIGDGAVGKTSIRKRFIGQGFNPVYLSTIGADFSTQTLILGSRNIKFQIWDLAGQPKFKEVRKTFYKGANGALLVYDVTNSQSFKNLENWITELWSHSKLDPIPLVLLGNKTDLEKEGIRSIPVQYATFLAEKYSKETYPKYGFGINFLKTSAKTGENINLAFELLAVQIAVQHQYQTLRQ